MMEEYTFSESSGPVALSKEVVHQETAPVPASAGTPTPGRDGGAFAWLQCGGSFFLFFNSWGLVNTFGVYQTFYEQSLLSISSSRIAWIGSLQAFLFVFGGVVAGPLYDHGYLQSLVRGGSFMVVFGMMMTSLCKEYWQLVLAQGIVVGLGNAALFVPSIALLPPYFVKRRALSTGIAITGGNVGGIIYSIIFHRLQPHLGFPWATRVIAFIMLITLILPMSCLRMRFKPSVARRFFDTSAWMEGPFFVFAATCFVGFIGLYIPYFYIGSYALDNQILDRDLAFYLLPIMNTGSILGRMILCYLADRIGPVSILLLCAIGCASFAFAWSDIHSSASTVMFCVFYGFFSGAYISVALTTVASTLCPNMGVIGLRTGMICIPCAAGLLVGSPVGGVIVGSGWLGVQMLTGGTMAASAVGVMMLRVLKVGWKVSVKC